MDNRPIGILDSGFGGLTALRELHRLLPREHLIYFGDNGRAPYGVRPPQQVADFTGEIISFLLRHDVKLIIVACGTATSALPLLGRQIPVPVIGVIEPAAQEACAATKTSCISVAGTELTVRTGKYTAAIHALLPHAEVTASPCQPFVTLVEHGQTDPSDPLVHGIVRGCLAPLRQKHTDTLILGCTHFPLLREVIAEELGSGITLIDSGACAARSAAAQLRQSDALCAHGAGSVRCFTSGEPLQFAKIGSRFAGMELTGLVCHANAEEALT